MLMLPAKTDLPAPRPLRLPTTSSGREKQTASRAGQSPLCATVKSTRREASLNGARRSPLKIAKIIGVVTARRVRTSVITVIVGNIIGIWRVKSDIATIVRNAVKIVVGREIVKGKARGIGVVKGTARGAL